ncbi:Rpn family recombination-promoting nuclease/putative transposase [Vibrio tapetis]|uniref:Transposase (putative) YhgA-like domain-containing protein n=1 Tax=Vibrio tapetis subsp. tapetis TaxID=1671868 RepID=A0A2N8ZHS5_9VIBR|nr:protein of unknown function [Vibrio tapetis subsp. tapetis]SON53516.1 protein of unknown function [Vibrio tapetis subsp. tapetis]
MATNNPHDGLFKSFLTLPEVAKDFLEIHLPPDIQALCDLSTLQLKSTSFLGAVATNQRMQIYPVMCVTEEAIHEGGSLPNKRFTLIIT